jgi:hypothetical protein
MIVPICPFSADCYRRESDDRVEAGMDTFYPPRWTDEYFLSGLLQQAEGSKGGKRTF